MKDITPRRKKVTVSLWLSGKPGRSQLSGVFKYANRRNWDIHLLQNAGELTADVIRAAALDGTDGFILGILPENTTVRNLIAKSPIPTVSIDIPDYAEGNTDTVLIKNDDLTLGGVGAKHLHSLGKFNDFGFVGDLRLRQWSADRERGFVETLRRLGHEAKIFHSPVCGLDADRNIDRERLADWLCGLKKPAAVMAAWDYRATHVLEACRQAFLRIPEQIALLGVDNDELLCETSRPTLSSVSPDFECEGYKAALALESLMRHKRPKITFECQPLGVVERDSTRQLAPAAHLIHEALVYINENACKGIKVSDVAEHLGVSRRLADLRFSSLQGESIGTALERRKLSEVQRLLSHTQLPIGRIAEKSGYANANRLSHLFHERFGMSMSDWRHRENHRRNPTETR